MIRRKIEYKPAAGPASMVPAGGSHLGANAVLGPGKMPIFVATPGVAACGILAATSKREGASARRSQQAAGPRPRLWPRGNGPTGGCRRDRRPTTFGGCPAGPPLRLATVLGMQTAAEIGIEWWQIRLARGIASQRPRMSNDDKIDLQQPIDEFLLALAEASMVDFTPEAIMILEDIVAEDRPRQLEFAIAVYPASPRPAKVHLAPAGTADALLTARLADA